MAEKAKLASAINQVAKQLRMEQKKQFKRATGGLVKDGNGRACGLAASSSGKPDARTEGMGDDSDEKSAKVGG